MHVYQYHIIYNVPKSPAVQFCASEFCIPDASAFDHCAMKKSTQTLSNSAPTCKITKKTHNPMPIPRA